MHGDYSDQPSRTDEIIQKDDKTEVPTIGYKSEAKVALQVHSTTLHSFRRCRSGEGRGEAELMNYPNADQLVSVDLGTWPKQQGNAMRCHYEVLEIERDANDDQIKKAYRKLALKWHPDKNPDRVEECTQYFALLQQAHEVLSDPHERAFYDRYRENILAGGADGDLKDEGVDLFGYFTSSCYSGFGDDKKGFYTVYRQLFEQLASEDYEYMENFADHCYPTFGNSTSDYEEVVSHFYGFWMDFSTVRSFAWLDEHDIRQAPNAKYAKMMEKENKKLRDVGKKQRNEQIRELVQFVRKRDKRVIAYRQVLEERRQEQEKKTEENRKRQIRQRLEDLQNYKENDKHKEDHLQDLREIEEALDAEYGGISGDSDEDILDPEDDLYCVACEKAFKNMKSKENHDKSKKHRENLALLRKHMLEEDAELLFDTPTPDLREENEESVTPQNTGGKRSKKQKKKDKRQKALEEDEEKDIPPQCSDPATDVVETEICKLTEETANLEVDQAKPKKARRKNKDTVKEEDGAPTGPKEAFCDACREKFESRSRLFAHLKETGHATLKTGTPAPAKKGKKKKC
uniref:DnaJ homolog subfamily C member 21 n=1 Tax=Steinernema glaseri TaxID=37863 RepID=A0A1I7YWR3_9BILA